MKVHLSCSRTEDEIIEITSSAIDTPALPGANARRGAQGRETRGGIEWLAWMRCEIHARERKEDEFLPLVLIPAFFRPDIVLSFDGVENIAL